MMMRIPQKSLAAVLVLLSCCCLTTTSAFLSPGPSTSNNMLKSSSSSSLLAFDVALAETIASAAAFPAVFVGVGTYLLNNESDEEKDEALFGVEAETRNDREGEDIDTTEVDIYRDTLLRYAGYANEVGEAFAPIVAPIFVPASYAVAITYVFADTIDKTRKVLDNGPYEERKLTTCAAIEGLDALIWQLAASVALPGYTIHQVVLIAVAILTASGVYDNGAEPSGIISAIPTAIGLGTIPLIVKPLDELAEVGMEVTFRKISAPYLESCEI